MSSPADGSEERRMLGAVPGVAAIGRGPGGEEPPCRVRYHHPSAGWGAARSVAHVLARTHEPLAGQQDHGVDSLREIVNLLLLRGNIGRPGAGPSPIRGHSNVQGNRTCGIDHRPKPGFLDRLAAVCKIDPPRAHGLDTVGSLRAMLRGEVEVFVGMAGKFAIATSCTAGRH
jgi:hypothetical protein